MKRAVLLIALLFALRLPAQTAEGLTHTSLPMAVGCSSSLNVSAPTSINGREYITINASAASGGACLRWDLSVDNSNCHAFGSSTDPITMTCQVSCFPPGTYKVHMDATCGSSPWAGYCDWQSSANQEAPFVISERHPFASLSAASGMPPGYVTINYDFGEDGPNGELQLWANDHYSSSELFSDASHPLSGSMTVGNIGAYCTPVKWNAMVRACNSDQWTKSNDLWIKLPPEQCPIPNDDTKCCANCGGSAPPPCIGPPVNVTNGDVSLPVPLFALAQSPQPVVFDLSYHSLAPFYPGSISSPIASGWTHPFATALRLVTPTRLLLLGPRGERDYFDQVTSTLWMAIKPRSSRDVVALSGTDYILKKTDGSEVHFDSTTGNWLSTRDRWGNTVSGTYTGGLLTAITDAFGRQVTLGYAAGPLTTIVLPDNSTWTLGYSGGELTSITDPTNHVWRTFEYIPDSKGVLRLLSAARDNAGKLLEGHAYDSADRGLSAYSEGGRDPYTLAYDTPSTGQVRVTEAVSGSNHVATYTIVDHAGQPQITKREGICSTCGGASNVETFTYSPLDQVLTRTDASGTITSYDYDSYGNILTLREAVGTPNERTKTYGHTYASWPTFLTGSTEPSATGNGLKTTAFSWNAGETLLTATETGLLSPAGSPVSRTRTTTFDAHHRVVTDDGPRTDVNDATTLAYYADADSNVNLRGRLKTVTNAAGQTTAYADYDTYGTARSITDPNGVVTTRVTDTRGRIVSQTIHAVPGDSNESSDYTSTWTYDDRDRLTETSTPLGKRTRYGYEDGLNRLTDTIRLDSNGNEVERHHVTFDAIGQKVRDEDQSCTSPATTCTSWITKRSEDYSYDVNGRLSAVLHPTPAGSAIRYTYDDEGKLTGVQDENHSTPNTTYGYDALKRLQRVTQTLGSGSAVTQYGYDAQDNLASVTDPNGNTTSYAYDDFHELQTQTSPVTGSTTYAYDEAGNLLSTTDANGATTTRTYDSLNRAATSGSTRSGQTESISWTYDAGSYAIGRLSSVTDPTGSTAYSYDRRGLLTREQKTIASNTYTTGYSYDADGNRATITYPSGRIVNYAFDFANRPSTVSAGTTGIITAASYLPFGPLTQLEYANGTVRSTVFDQRYRPQSNTLTGPGSVLAQYTYAEDAVGNITQIHDGLDVGRNRDFGYDDLNRLVTANSGARLWGAGTYTYDPMGNMQTLGLGSSHSASFSYTGTTPRLTNVTENGTANPVTYDSAGNQLAAGPVVSAYSPRNQLASAGGQTYAYDARGVRTTTFSDLPALTSLTLAPTNVDGGDTVAGTVTLSAPAPLAGANVLIMAAMSPATELQSVVVPAGATNASFSFGAPNTDHTIVINIVASCGQSELTQTLTINPGAVIGTVSLPASVLSGLSATGTITLVSPVLHDTTVRLTSSDPAATVPATMTMPAGSSSGTFTVAAAAVPTSTTVTITATAPVSSSTATITVLPVAIASVVVSPTSVTGGSSATGVVTLNGIPGSAGVTIALASTDPSVANVPATLNIPAGAQTGSFSISTTTVSASTQVTITATLNGTATTPLGVAAAGGAPRPILPPGDNVWINDALPSGATISAGAMAWDTAEAADGTQSFCMTPGAPSPTTTYLVTMSNLAQPLKYGETLVFYGLLDAANPPREVKVTWTNSNGMSKAAYWGERLIGGEATAYNRGPLATGSWLRFELPTTSPAVLFSGATITGIRIEYYGGRAWFDHIGSNGQGCAAPVAAPPTLPPTDAYWIDDSVAAGVYTSGSQLVWDATQKASGGASMTTTYAGSGGVYTQLFSGMTTQPLMPGDRLVAYMLINPCVVPTEVELTWYTSPTTRVSAWWGATATFGDEAGGVAMGAIPATGVWTRVEIPAAQLGLEGATITGFRWQYRGGNAWFDAIGVATAAVSTHLTDFSADKLSPQPSGTTITWTATATGSVPPLQYRFERLVSGAWQVVQAYSSANTYSWTPGIADAGDQTIRVSVRNNGSLADFEDTRTATMTITSGSGLLLRPESERFAWWNPRRWKQHHVPVALSVSGRYAETSTAGGPRRYSLYTPELNLMAETETTSASAPAIAYEYVWFAGQPVAQIETATNTIHYYFNDHLGTPVLTTDATGAVDWRVEREPYGKIYATITGVARHQPLSLPGQEDDGGAASYNIFRWYRAGWGSYTQADPIGLASGENVFAYALENPIRVFDSVGLFAQLLCRQVSAAAGSNKFQKTILDVYKPFHCRLRVKCGCAGGSDFFDKTLGRENVNPKGSPGIYDTTMDDYSSSKYSSPPWSSTPVDSYGSTNCQFEKCVLKAFAAQDANNSGLLPKYNGYPGPNSNTFVKNLIEQCGGSAAFPPKAKGSDYEY